MWWALIEEIALRSEEIACEKEMACCVRVYHVYEDMLAAAIGESAGVSLLVCPLLVCRRRKNFYCKIIFA